MIYTDTSVVLAQLLAEDHRPPNTLWQEPLIASRLLEYEIWNRLHAKGLDVSHGHAAAEVLARISLVELSPVVLRRALDSFPVPVRTLDSLHLASLDFLLQRRLAVRLATYDQRMTAAADAMAIPLYDIG